MNTQFFFVVVVFFSCTLLYYVVVVFFCFLFAAMDVLFCKVTLSVKKGAHK